MKAPLYSLDEVKKLVAANAFSVMRGRGLSLLVPTLGYVGANSFVAAAIHRLSIDNFYATVKLTYDVADEYGINIDGTGWYIKLYIDTSVPEVTVISFHPPQRAMRTAAGLVKPPPP